ncbi:hypothetical protein KBD45_03600 [Candidatus Dojkabacteria bacterium]|nr:hypothetical protein [Candidatus Dojkabacteria bacterium]
MSRILVINKKERFDVEENFKIFAEVSENNPTPDGNWQGDGWGISYIDPLLKWRGFKTFVSIWKNIGFAHIFMPSNIFMLHVRTLIVEEEYVSEENNLPYFNDELSLVYDGDQLESKIDKSVKPLIDRIWEQIQIVDKSNLESEFKTICEQINLEAEGYKAFNLVLSDKQNMYVYCKYNPEAESYYQIHYFTNELKTIISSQPLEIEDMQLDQWQKLQNGEYKTFKMFENLTS